MPLTVAAEEIDSETCTDCHDELQAGLDRTAHRLTDMSGQGMSVGCISCHSGGEEHIEDPTPENISNPAKQDGYDVRRKCSGCHVVHESLDNFGFDTHSTLDISCTECHTVHSGHSERLLDDRAEFCQRCHSETMTAFRRRSNHPIVQSVLTCVDCHKFTRRSDADFSYDLDRICRDCHPDRGGPFLYEHEAVNSYTTEESGCIRCHEPHGSENDRLLRQAGNDLCRQCHIEHVTRNHANLWDEVFSKFPCQKCHVDTHGSFVSELLLDPDLESIVGGGSCYNPGCHSLNGN